MKRVQTMFQRQNQFANLLFRVEDVQAYANPFLPTRHGRTHNGLDAESLCLQVLCQGPRCLGTWNEQSLDRAFAFKEACQAMRSRNIAEKFHAALKQCSS